MTNIAKHAQASEVIVRLTKTADQAILEIQDDGIGFTVPRDWLELARQGHLGLVSIRERAEEIGGAVLIASNLPKGTQIKVIVPLVDVATAGRRKPVSPVQDETESLGR